MDSAEVETVADHVTGPEAGPEAVPETVPEAVSETVSTMEEREWVAEMNDELLWQWRNEAKRKSTVFQKAGDYYKRKDYWVTLPPPIITIVAGAITPLLEPTLSAKWITASVVIASGIMGYLSRELKLGQKYEQCYGFSARYGDLVSEIDTMMIAPVEVRRKSNLREEVQRKMEVLNINSPSVVTCFSKHDFTEELRGDDGKTVLESRVESQFRSAESIFLRAGTEIVV